MSKEQKGFPLVCIYDNPSTWRREVWQDGMKIASFCWTLFDNADIARKTIPFYCPTSPFEPKQLWGDVRAMDLCEKPDPVRWWQIKNIVALLEAADSEPKRGGDE